MKIAFVGVKRKYLELPKEYRDVFNQFHLELPFYYARDGKNQVVITTVDHADSSLLFDHDGSFSVDSSLLCLDEKWFKKDQGQFDVVVHWRKWFPELYRPEAVNLLVCQDHSFNQEWITSVKRAIQEKKLRGILCFPGWHKRNLQAETGLPEEVLFDGVTLGVDTEIYRPHENQDPYQMLWSSDPGRGLAQALQLAVQLHARDRRFHLHVCGPDYAQNPLGQHHPAFSFYGFVPNSPSLWSLFGKCGVMPYTSNFKEPSSRSHRQAQAAGMMVLYPPSMGTPSELIESDRNGIVSDPTGWADTIVEKVESGDWKRIGEEARKLALSEDWKVQANRFNDLCKRLIGEKQ